MLYQPEEVKPRKISKQELQLFELAEQLGYQIIGAAGTRLVPTRGYSTTMALSTLKNMLSTQYLQRGDGTFATPASRRAARLFGTGRLTRGSTGIKLEKLQGDGYEPASDTCLSAFVRLLKEAAESQGDSE